MNDVALFACVFVSGVVNGLAIGLVADAWMMRRLRKRLRLSVDVATAARNARDGSMNWQDVLDALAREGESK